MMVRIYRPYTKLYDTYLTSAVTKGWLTDAVEAADHRGESQAKISNEIVPAQETETAGTVAPARKRRMEIYGGSTVGAPA